MCSDNEGNKREIGNRKTTGKIKGVPGKFFVFVLMTHEARQNEGRGKRRKISNLSTKVTITEC